MKLPIIPTIIVAAAIAAMVGLGIWQLQRAEWKEGLIARYHQAENQPPMAWPAFPADVEDILFRRANGFCLSVTGWRVIGGRAQSGRTGSRYIAECRTGAEGPGMLVDMGVSRDPAIRPSWRGGEVSGTITAEPQNSGLFERLLGRAPPPRPMLVSQRPAPGLEASAAPSPEGITNNHRAYAAQWFFFAIAAAAIYVLALRRRGRAAGTPEDSPPGSNLP
jgi:cytochrome oxidase assembly protein ShyY1